MDSVNDSVSKHTGFPHSEIAGYNGSYHLTDAYRLGTVVAMDGYAIGGTRDWTYDETYCNNAAVNTARGNEPCSTNDKRTCMLREGQARLLLPRMEIR